MRSANFCLTFACAIAMAGCGSPSEQPVENATQEEAMRQVEVKPIDPVDTVDAGPAIGAQIPANITFLTGEGQLRMSDILKDGPAVLIFTRSVEWCPFCQTQLKSINGIVGDIKERGYNIYGVSYDSPGAQDRFAMNQMLEYQMLSDEKSAAIDAFGIRDPQYTEGRAVGVPYASIFMISKDGTITGKSVSGDYKKRPTNQQLLMLLDAS